ncbi:MAG: histidine--tRNA ligase [Alphaproteobacteria bacterium]|nr:histidine--tRNA ligase [Alphaproteobacteria bacterium]
MAKLQPVRGTHDLIGNDARRHRAVGETARQVAGRYGYDDIVTPIFEFSEVFTRSLGDTTDVVTKEMYTFTDKGGETVTLRPENTAGVVRAVLSNSLLQQAPLKYFYVGPMFRYERPQKGRQRQFHQIGIELIGVPEPAGDVEVIACGWAILKALGFSDKITLELNTLGDSESRASYREALVAYFRGHLARLSADSQARLDRNPLRILDSKDEGDRALVAAAPAFGDFLTPGAREFFKRVTGGLETLGIGYALNPRLVRGLDYYCHTAFEFTTTALGAQGTVMGGGRYDGLVEQMGGPATAGVGWAAGVERLAMLLAADPPAPRPVAIVPVGEKAEAAALALADRLRASGLRVELGYRGNLKRRFEQANKRHAIAALILGDDELARGVAALKDLDSGEQADVALAELDARLARYR